MKFKKMFALLGMTLCLCGCNQMKNINHNIQMEADSFKVYRKFSLVNLRSDKILLEAIGYLAIDDSTSTELAITIKIGEDEYMKHLVYTGAETCYIIEQLENTSTDPYHYEINLYWVVPDIKLG